MANNKSKVDRKKFVTFVVEEFDRYEKFHEERFSKATRIYNAWIGKPPSKDYDWMNNIHVPMMIEAEQTVTPRIFTALFPSDAPVDCQVEGDTPPQAGVVVKHLTQHYFRVSNAQGAAWTTLTQNTLFGTGYAEAGSWLVKRGYTTDEQGNWRYGIVESRPDCKHVDFFEMFPHPAKINMDDGMPLIRRRWVDSEYIKSLAENPYFNFEDLDKAINSKSSKHSENSYTKKDGDEYEILDYWGPYDDEFEKDGKLNKRKAVPYWGIIINREVAVRCMPNPYNHQKPPFVKTKLFEDAKPSWFGVGVGIIGLPSQERLNKLINQRMDNVDIILNKMGVYNKNDTLINKKDLMVSKPGKWIGVEDINQSLKWMDIPDVTAEAYKEEAIAKADFRESTGATSSMMPSDNVGDQHQTAMGIQLLQGAAGMRFRPVLRNLEIDFIQQIAMFFFSNARQFMTIPEWVRITGEEGKRYNIRVSPQDIQGKVFFIPTGVSETVNKETMIGQLERFKELTVNDPTINRTELNKRIAELMGFKDVDKLVIKQQPSQMGEGQLQPEMQQRIQQRMQEGADPEQIKLELFGNPEQGGGGQPQPDQSQMPLDITQGRG